MLKSNQIHLTIPTMYMIAFVDPTGQKPTPSSPIWSSNSFLAGMPLRALHQSMRFNVAHQSRMAWRSALEIVLWSNSVALANGAGI